MFYRLTLPKRRNQEVKNGPSFICGIYVLNGNERNKHAGM